MRRETLNTIRQNYVKQLQSQADGRAGGAVKAQERAATRLKLAQEVLEAAQIVMSTVQEAGAQLDLEHTARGEHKRLLGEAVLELVDDKLNEMDTDEVDFHDPLLDGVAPPAKETEDDRDEAQRLTGLLEQQVLQFRAAAAVANAKIAEQATALEQAAAGTARQTNCK